MILLDPGPPSETTVEDEFDPGTVPSELRELVGSKVRQRLIAANWPDVLRSAATMVAGVIAPSQLLRKFASYL